MRLSPSDLHGRVSGRHLDVDGRRSRGPVGSFLRSTPITHRDSAMAIYWPQGYRIGHQIADGALVEEFTGAIGQPPRLSISPGRGGPPRRNSTALSAPVVSRVSNCSSGALVLRLIAFRPLDIDLESAGALRPFSIVRRRFVARPEPIRRNPPQSKSDLLAENGLNTSKSPKLVSSSTVSPRQYQTHPARWFA